MGAHEDVATTQVRKLRKKFWKADRRPPTIVCAMKKKKIHYSSKDVDKCDAGSYSKDVLGHAEVKQFTHHLCFQLENA